MTGFPTSEWFWWIGNDEETYHTQCDSREEAIEIINADYDSAYICEAIKRPLKLSDQFDAQSFLERADEDSYDDYIGENGDDIFSATKPQTDDLQKMVRSAMDAWQKKHDIKFIPWMFSEMRNEEHIEAVKP